MTRVISGLISAKIVPRPKCIPLGRARGAKAKGLAYERALAKALPQAQHGTWFQFEDSKGPGYCQVDLLLELPRGIILLESKYTWTAEGHFQLEKLYSPIVEKVFGKPTVGLVVCKKLVPGMSGVKIVGDLESAADVLRLGQGRVALQWLGNCPLLVDYQKLALAA